jgi:hypothetical protein
VFLNQVYFNAHSVKKIKRFNYNEFEKASSLTESILIVDSTLQIALPLWVTQVREVDKRKVLRIQR